MYYQIAVMAQAVDMTGAQTVDMTTPNWTLLGIIIGIMVVIAILLLIPSKEVEALEDAEKKSKPALKFDAKKALEDNSDDVFDKSKQSLAEIKVAKRAVVSDEKSKEEMRELRKARRAAAQTEKAIQEREEKASEKSSSEDENLVEELKKEEKSENREDDIDTTEKSDAKLESSLSKGESEIVEEQAMSQILEMPEIDEEQTSSDSKTAFAQPDAAVSNEVMVDVTAGTGDMFATLFGDEPAGGSLSFDEILGTSSNEVDDGTIFPTLGSALIPLNEIEKAANEKADGEGVDALDELTRRLSDRAEKKTPL